MLREMGIDFKNLKELNAYRVSNGRPILTPDDECLRFCHQNELFDMETQDGIREAIRFYEKHPDRCFLTVKVDS